MKSIKLFITIMFVAAFSAVSLGQITGSAHDFQLAAWNSTGEICITCHTPHNAEAVVGSVLWNHDTTLVTDFEVYTSNTLTATDVGQPSGISKLCLSCHDGTVGLEDFGGNAYATNTPISGDALVGTILSNDHPISFDYTTALSTADPGLRNPSVYEVGVGGNTGGTITSQWLNGDQMECSSCHDVHDAGIDFLLRKDNTASALCLTCHNK